MYGEGKISALMLGMLVGDKSFFTKDDYQMFIDSSLVHLVAVSGGNMVMLLIFLGFIFKRVPFYVRQVLLLGGLVGYAMLCGADSSVIRAVVMGGLGLLALM